MKLSDLEVYRLSLKLSEKSWEVYSQFNWEQKKIMGDQFIRSSDSVGANIAEGYGRYYYLDKIRFFYNSRGSLTETQHWITLLLSRKLLKPKDHHELSELLILIIIKLNNLISSTYSSKAG